MTLSKKGINWTGASQYGAGLVGFFVCFEKKELFVSKKLVVGDCGDKIFETLLIICCNLLCKTRDSSPLNF